MNITYNVNDKIKVLSFLCTVMVLFRHSRNLVAFWGTEHVNNLTAYIENFVSVLTEVAVPTFFIISGYFFFKYDYYENNNYILMIKKKYKTLVIPFVFWNIMGALALLSYDPESIEINIQSAFYNLLLSKWNGPLWYVRDLILIMFLVPFYAWIYKVNNIIIYLVLFTILYIRWWPIDISLLSSEGLFFFFVGSLIRKNKSILEYRLPFIFFLLLLSIWLFYSLNLFPFYDKNTHRINTIIGIIVFWRLVDYIKGRCLVLLYNISAYSFFIYVMHTYLIKMIKRIIAYFCYENNAIALLTYIFVPVITIIIVFFIAKFWKKYFYQSYLIVSGGR